MRIRLLSILFVVGMMINQKILGQLSPKLTLEELMPGGKNYAKFSPVAIRQFGFCAETAWWIVGDSMYVCDGRKRSSKLFLNKREVNTLLESQKLSSVKHFPRVSVSRLPDTGFGLISDDWYVVVDPLKKSIRRKIELSKRYENRDISPDQKSVAFTSENNLYVVNAEKVIQVTKERSKEIVCGRSVHRDEFGIYKGTFWSPSGAYLAFYRMDESMVSEYPGVDISARVAEYQPFKYPMAGMKSHQVTVGLYDVRRDRTYYLRTGKPLDRYLTNISFSPDEKSIFLAEVNRAQDSCSLVQYSATDGRRQRILFTETSDTWVEPEHPAFFLDNDHFLWLSQRDGFRHLYLYDIRGNCLKQLTRGNWQVNRIRGLDATKEHLFYESTEVSPLEVRLYALNLSTGKSTLITSETGIHRTRISSSGRRILSRYTAPDVPNTLNLYTFPTGSLPVQTLFRSPNPFAGSVLPEVEVGTIMADDGRTDLYYRLVKPRGWEIGKRYPTIIYVYGGPHKQLINRDYLNGVRGWDLYMAERGYVVFSLDNRGSANRGRAFETVVHGRLGEIEMADQMRGVEFLCTLPFVDPTRLGVHGWSFGGFMTTLMMLQHPDRFKVGVAGGAVTDWSLYEVMYTERYMGNPKKNKAGYEANNLCLKADRLSGKLLMIHDDQDPVVVLQHAFRFLKACVMARTYPDFFVYPGHQHNVVGEDRVHLYEKITRYFDEYL